MTGFFNFLGKILDVFKKYPWQFLFGIACVVIFFMDTCKEPCPEVTPDSNDTAYVNVYIHDTIDHYDTTYIPVPGKVIIKEVPKWIDLEVDTQAILNMYVDYFAYVISNDTILNDTNGFVRVLDTIHKNRIMNRTVEKKFYPTYIKIVKTIKEEYQPSNQLYVGGAVGGSLTSFGAEVTGMFINKKKRAYTLSYDLIQNEVKVGVMIKIF